MGIFHIQNTARCKEKRGTIVENWSPVNKRGHFPLVGKTGSDLSLGSRLLLVEISLSSYETLICAEQDTDRNRHVTILSRMALQVKNRNDGNECRS